MYKINKRHAHHVWRQFRKVKPQYFIIAALVFGIVSLITLRHNNEHMVQLRDAVYAADKNNGNVETALRDLRQYVYTHMNTSLASGPNAVHPPIQLKYTYERLEQAQQNVLGQGNSSLYTEAQKYCEGQTAIGSEVISCIQTYATSHGASFSTIPDGLYKFDFTSAKFSFDLAGWSIIVAVCTAVLALISALYHWWVKRYIT